jgi:hypothetical protein
MMKNAEWITIDYLEFFCQRNQLMIGCRSDESEIWISELGLEPTGLSVDEVQGILKESSLFELRSLLAEEESFIDDSLVLTRGELEQRLRLLLN